MDLSLLASPVLPYSEEVVQEAEAEVAVVVVDLLLPELEAVEQVVLEDQYLLLHFNLPLFLALHTR
jgi:hypothetical protein